LKAEYETIKDTSPVRITNYSITEKNKEASDDLLPVLEKKHKSIEHWYCAAGQRQVQGIHLKIQINIQPN
jgi:hypothetical protein